MQSVSLLEKATTAVPVTAVTESDVSEPVPHGADSFAFKVWIAGFLIMAMMNLYILVASLFR
jgi:hypothetical protein